VIGCGPLGRQLGLAALERGLAVCVHDLIVERCERLASRGATVGADPRDVASRSQLVVTALPDDEAVADVYLAGKGLCDVEGQCRAILDVSTVTPSLMERVAARFEDTSIDFLDAAAGLGSSTSRDPRLVMWVSGSARAYARVRGAIEAMSVTTMFCGDIGAAQIVKLVNNSVAHCQMLVLTEALTVGVKAGVSLDVLAPALCLGTAQSRLLQEVLPRGLFRGDFTPGLRLEKARREIEMLIELAADRGADVLLARHARDRFVEAEENGLGGLSSHAVARIHEKRTDTRLRFSPSE
jgi:3-hydroxyisobutyrate dehydrogenase-like beta-hydroxyacid dehydrogenase